MAFLVYDAPAYTDPFSSRSGIQVSGGRGTLERRHLRIQTYGKSSLTSWISRVLGAISSSNSSYLEQFRWNLKREDYRCLLPLKYPVEIKRAMRACIWKTQAALLKGIDWKFPKRNECTSFMCIRLMFIMAIYTRWVRRCACVYMMKHRRWAVPMKNSTEWMRLMCVWRADIINCPNQLVLDAHSSTMGILR